VRPADVSKTGSNLSLPSLDGKSEVCFLAGSELLGSEVLSNWKFVFNCFLRD